MIALSMQASCAPVPTTSNRSYAVQLCQQSAYRYVEVRSSAVESLDNSELWVLRVGGEHPQTVVFHRENRAAWRAPFRVCARGWYSIHVRLLLRARTNSAGEGSFAQCAPPADEAALVSLYRWRDGHNNSSSASGAPANCSHDIWRWTNKSSCGSMAAASCQADDSIAQLHACSATDHPPTPQCMLCPSRCPHPLLQLAEGTTPGTATTNASAASARLMEGLEYGHTHETLAAAAEYPRYARRRRRCYVGDSHTRMLHNTMALLSGLGKPQDCDLRKQQVSHGTCHTTRDIYASLNFPRAVEVDMAMKALKLSIPLDDPLASHFASSNTSHHQPLPASGSAFECDDVIVNAGQWPSSFRVAPLPSKHWQPPHVANLSAGLPWPAETAYAEGVHYMLSRLAAWRDAGRRELAGPARRVFWVATNPSPLTPYHRMCPPRDFRFPNVIAGYNAAARAVAARHRVHYIDTQRIALPLLELSWDGIHYLEPVGTEIARAVAAALVLQEQVTVS